MRFLRKKTQSEHKLKVEYYFLDEETGDTKEKAIEQNRNYQSHVDDNQLLVQLELNF